MAENDGDGGNEGLTRREVIKRAAIVGGAAVWAAPVIRMAVGSGGGPRTDRIVASRLAVFDGPCSSVLLADPTTTRTVCATTLTKARAAFESTVNSECEARCRQLGPCSDDKCKVEKRQGTAVGTITCTGPGPTCPVPPYATGGTQFVCTAIVTCNCVCR